MTPKDKSGKFNFEDFIKMNKQAQKLQNLVLEKLGKKEQPPQEFTFEVFMGLVLLIGGAIALFWLWLWTMDSWATEHNDNLPPLSQYFAKTSLKQLNDLGIYEIRCEPNKGCYAYTTSGDYNLPQLNQGNVEKNLDVGLDIYKRYKYGLEIYGNYPSVMTLQESEENMKATINSFATIVAQEKPGKEQRKQEIHSSWSR